MSTKWSGPRLMLRLPDREERHSTSGCLLAVILLLPCCIDFLGPSLIILIFCFYTIIIVPVWMKYIHLITLIHVLQFFLQTSWNFLTKIVYILRRIMLHYESDKMLFWQIILQQETVFIMSEYYNSSAISWPILLLIYHFLFSSNFYQDWQHKKTLCIWCKVLLLTKIFVIHCLIYFIINYKLWSEQCFHIYYTLIYFIITHERAIALLSSFLSQFQMEIFENLENCYWTIACNFISIFYPIIYIFRSHQLLILCGLLYITVYVPLKRMLRSFRWLQNELNVISQFPKASKQTLLQLEDVCAICLQSMNHARVLPCGHCFHGHCIREAIKKNYSCPLCKYLLCKQN